LTDIKGEKLPFFYLGIFSRLIYSACLYYEKRSKVNNNMGKINSNIGVNSRKKEKNQQGNEKKGKIKKKREKISLLEGHAKIPALPLPNLLTMLLTRIITLMMIMKV
jgi:hypothetical protein